MEKEPEGFARGRILAWLMAVVVVSICALTFSSGAAAQQKKKSGNTGNTDLTQGMPQTPASISDEIDHGIGEMLGAFQVGDVEAMHKHYADNATFVSGSYEPPLAGWNNYVAQYEKQKAAFQGMQLIRRNTFVFVHGDVSWVSYQWQFAALFNNRPFTARGQTTLVLSKVGENWLIVHNHTSEICPGQAPSAPQPQQSPQPQQQP